MEDVDHMKKLYCLLIVSIFYSNLYSSFDDETLLMKAVKSGQPDMVADLISARADLNAVDSHGNTALEQA